MSRSLKNNPAHEA